MLSTRVSTPLSSSTSSPRPSTSRSLPPQQEDETPDVYLERLIQTVSKVEVANVLAGSGDAFHQKALQIYMNRFDFRDEPLDIALRKLLMDTALPRETQQIDRVMESFAARYSECNMGMFMTNDQPYVLAFSLMMLHTDAFNKSNKNKMTKAEYVKNTRLPGVAPETLEYYFDNITFAPFIFIEDSLDVNGSMMFSSPASSIAPTSSTSSILGRQNKVDPYFLITQNLLHTLRVDVRSLIPTNNPFSYLGTATNWNFEELRRAFLRPDFIELEDQELSQRRKSFMVGQFSPLTFNGAIGPISAPAVPAFFGDGLMDEPWPNEQLTLRVTKAGLLSRKDELSEGGRRASSRRWRDWSVILTGSQLLFFRDATLATNMLALGTTSGQQLLVPLIDSMKPDEIVSVYDSVALYDHSYIKYSHTFRLAMPKGRQILLRTSNEDELNTWISRINYASAFKTSGVRMRPLAWTTSDSGDSGRVTASVQSGLVPQQIPVRSWTTGSPLCDSVPASSSNSPSRPSKRRGPRTSFDGTKALDLEDYVSSLEGSPGQDRAVNDQRTPNIPSTSTPRPPPRRTWTNMSSASVEDRKRSASRAELMNSKIRDLDSKINTSRLHLESDLRVAKTLAVLSPFQQTTRDRIQLAVNSLAKRVAMVRMDLEKLQCHRDVLSADIANEEHEWRSAKSLQFQDATRTLTSQSTANLPLTQERTVTTLEKPAGFCLLPPLRLDCLDSVLHMESAPPTQASEPPTPRTPVPPSSTSDQSTPGSVLTPGTPYKVASVDQANTEICEDWDRTRAAKRVSLVRLPAQELSAMFGLQVQHILESAELN